MVETTRYSPVFWPLMLNEYFNDCVQSIEEERKHKAKGIWGMS